jgi:hypothetical protein
MNLFRFFRNLFKKKAMVRLIDYGSAQLMALVADNPSGLHTERIAALTAAFNLLDDGMEDVETKAAIQRGKVLAKNLFRRNTVPETVARIQAAVVVHYGANSPDMAECFPQGREVFHTCKDQVLDQHLGQLSTCIAARSATVGAPIATDAAGLVTTWGTCLGEVGSAGGDVMMMRAIRQNAKKALAEELFQTLLHLAAKYPDNDVKFNQYVPEEKLNPPAAPVPDAATLEVVGGAGQFAATPAANGAETFVIRYRLEGAPDYIIAVEDWPGGPFIQNGLSAGTYEVIALGVNDSGTGEPSEIATALVT